MRDKEIIYDEYSRRIEIKKEELVKRRSEIEAKEREYDARYQVKY